MKAIIIEDKDCKALLDKLKLQSMNDSNVMRRNPDSPATLEEVHRAFVFVVVRWLQEQGASLHGS